MRDFGGIIVVGIIAIVLLFNVFGNDEASRGMSGSYTEDTYNELPSEPSRSEILENIRNSNASSIEELIKNNFPLLDTVQSDQGRSRIYMTKELSLPEVSEALSDKIKPEEISERQEGKQALIYPNRFVILQESEEEPGVVTIELASEQFVRNNYHPSFFQGLLAYSILNRVLGVNDWHNKRNTRCKQTGDCYSGYGMYGNYNSGSGSLRGSSNRGGGPGAGK
ncbi:DUF4247 domain-containing protein [Halobacillus sp. BBL2006]|uniref:DUF4247 domain-containing protein n=1 Tax=Halobacillus sp. BBL2006 TaxID=1543706 RepID=UPI000543EF5E|nr:DUF4247 domain-containing protein [Halobacillus sp. BBL2006]KHE72210.1 hypothetical protein LD39_05760 [Halobacillus sp. BBL2006]